MWHLKTRFGIFWVIPVLDSTNRFFLGVNDHSLGEYKEPEQAAQDVHNQCTGYFKWDTEAKIKAPSHINEWVEGEPNEWHRQH